MKRIGHITSSEHSISKRGVVYLLSRLIRASSMSSDVANWFWRGHFVEKRHSHYVFWSGRKTKLRHRRRRRRLWLLLAMSAPTLLFSPRWLASVSLPLVRRQFIGPPVAPTSGNFPTKHWYKSIKTPSSNPPPPSECVLFQISLKQK